MQVTTHWRPNPRCNTPWGIADNAEPFTDESGLIIAWHVTTPSHGGFWVPPEQREHIPEALRETKYSKGGWFEEDCDWAIPYYYLSLGPLDPFKDQTELARDMLTRHHKVETL